MKKFYNLGSRFKVAVKPGALRQNQSSLKITFVLAGFNPYKPSVLFVGHKQTM